MAIWKKLALATGTSGQFVKGDGSFDSNSYSQTSHTHSYLPLGGGTVSGGLQVTGMLEIYTDNSDNHIRFHDTGNTWYSIGSDYTDGKFKINYGGTVGEQNHFSMNSSGDVTIGGTLGVNGFNAIKYSYFGYSSSYPAVVIGGTGAQSLFFNVDVVANPSGQFTGAGAEYVWRNAGAFLTPNSINNGYTTLLNWNANGQITFPQNTTIGGTLSVSGGATITSNSNTVGLKVFGGGNTGVDYIQVGYEGGSASPMFKIAYNGAATFSSSVTATSLIKSGGTSSQFLKADGSVDTNTYITSSALTPYSLTTHNHNGTYLPISGGTLTGDLYAPSAILSSTFPMSLTGNSQTGTYTKTVIYANQNNTSGSNVNGIFIERGRLADNSGAEIRHFCLGGRGGSVQLTVDGNGKLYANSDVGINVPYSYANSHNFYLSNTLYGYGTYPVLKTNFQSMYFECQNTYTGNISYNTGFVDVSDATLKTNIRIIPNAVSKVKALEGVLYNWIDNRDNSQDHIGVVAQQIELIVPEVVTTDETGIKAVSYSGLTALCIEAIKELTNRIEILENNR